MSEEVQLFCAPVALPVVAQVFEEHEALDQLEAFTSLRGAAFYDVGPNADHIVLAREEWTVPDLIDGVVPYRAGMTLPWRIAD